MLKTNCEIFNLNWRKKRGDSMARNPIVLEGPTIEDKMDMQKLMKEAQRASIPYVPNVIKRMQQI